MPFLLGLIPTIALSQPSFALKGLHVELTMPEAIAQAEKLGAHCQQGSFNRAKPVGDSIHCNFPVCVEEDDAGNCKMAEAFETPTIAAQPIVNIVLEAPEKGGPLARILIFHEGDTDIVAADLVAQFGPTDADGAPTGKRSWSHARRWSWTQGQYRMGLLNAPQMVVLAVDRVH
jgi:hypothetical protein